MDALPPAILVLAALSAGLSLGFLARALIHGLRIERHHMGDCE